MQNARLDNLIIQSKSIPSSVSYKFKVYGQQKRCKTCKDQIYLTVCIFLSIFNYFIFFETKKPSYQLQFSDNLTFELKYENLFAFKSVNTFLFHISYYF